jgi:hypothetical protein
MHFGVSMIESWELARTRWSYGSEERKGGGFDGKQGGLLKEARVNESGATATVERKKYGTKERRHRPRRIDLGKTGGRMAAERVRRGKKVVLRWTCTSGDFSTFLNWLFKFPPAGTVIPSVPLGEMKGKPKLKGSGSVICSDSRSS